MGYIFVVAIHGVLFGPEYIASMSTAECDYRLSLTWERCSIQDASYRREGKDGKMDCQLYFTFYYRYPLDKGARYN